jgi:hypothetical protein
MTFMVGFHWCPYRYWILTRPVKYVHLHTDDETLYDSDGDEKMLTRYASLRILWLVIVIGTEEEL